MKLWLESVLIYTIFVVNGVIRELSERVKNKKYEFLVIFHLLAALFDVELDVSDVENCNDVRRSIQRMLDKGKKMKTQE